MKVLSFAFLAEVENCMLFQVFLSSEPDENYSSGVWSIRWSMLLMMDETFTRFLVDFDTFRRRASLNTFFKGLGGLSS